ncbi:YdaS family helix-turn-helix protein [Methylobacterium brachiatum]
MTSNQRAFARAIAAAKGQAPLARAIGTSQSNVWEWLNRSPRGVPAEWVLRVEAATEVPRHILRPDLYPPPSIAASVEAQRASA